MISMPRLKSILEGGGYEEVMTYINSGNVLFKSGEEDIIRLQADIHALLLRELGLDLSVMIISAGDLIEVSKNLPDWWGRGEGQSITLCLSYRLQQPKRFIMRWVRAGRSTKMSRITAM